MSLKKIVTILLLSVVTIIVAGCESVTNSSPEIISESTIEAIPGVHFSYRLDFVDPDSDDNTVIFENYPCWMTADADSIFGIPPYGICNAGFDVIVYDGFAADTAHITVYLVPIMAVYGDTRTGHATHQAVVNLMMTINPSVVFHTGDLVNDGRIQAEWDMFNSITAEMRAQAEFFPTLGNHEEQSQLYFDNFELPGNEQWYSVERNYTHFICLNSCIQTDTLSVQYQWLKNDLESIHDSIRFIVAYFHHPPYSTGPHTEDEQGLRQTWVPLFEQYGVDVVFNGHDHDYERSLCGDIYYIVAGGGGAPLRDQARTHPCSELFLKQYHFCKLVVIGNRMIVTVYDLSMNIIDRFALRQDIGPVPLP
jgi:3',5'-cyclic AMP phosphodiesterase CpdA